MTEVTLDKIVAMCDDCESLCTDRTRRFVEDIGLKPYGSEWKMNEEATARRQLMKTKCLDACTIVKLGCPSERRVRAYLEAEASAKHNMEALHSNSGTNAAAMSPSGTNAAAQSTGSKSGGGSGSSWFSFGKKAPSAQHQGTDGSPSGATFGGNASPVLFAPPESGAVTLQEMTRCETAAERFTSVLFTIAARPTKVEFEDRPNRPRDNLFGGTKNKRGGSGAFDLDEAAAFSAASATPFSTPGGDATTDFMNTTTMAGGAPPPPAVTSHVHGTVITDNFKGASPMPPAPMSFTHGGGATLHERRGIPGMDPEVQRALAEAGRRGASDVQSYVRK